MSPQPLINGESMSVPEQKPIVVYRANGTSTDFPITFDLHDETQLHVSVNYIVLDVSEYNLNDRNVVFNTPPKDGDEVILSRLTARERETNYQSFNNSFRPQALNWDFNKIWHVLQEQNILDAEILARINQQIEWHRTHNFNFDYLASVREQRVAEGLKGYSDTLAAALMQNNLGNVFRGVTAGVVFADDNRSVQTWLGELTPLEYTEKALYALNNGAFKAYPTLQAANADIENIPLNVKIEVLSAADGGSYYKENEDSVTLTKSQYDARKVAVSEAQDYTNQKIIELDQKLTLTLIDADDANTDPLEPLDPPPPSANITINTLSATKNTKPTISGTGESGRTVSIVIAKAGATIQTLSAIVASNGTWSTVPDTALSNGAHTITASHTNSVGNTTTASTTLTIDTTAPALTVTPIATASATNITVSGTSEASAAIKVTIGSISLTTTSNGTWAVNTTLAVGTHTINVSATDAAGNVANASTTVTITSDATEPTDPVEPNLDNLYNKELINKGWYVTQLGAITSAGAANPEWSMFILPVEQGATYRLKLSIASPQKLAWHDTLEPVAAYQAISLAIATVDPSDPSFYLVTVPDNPAIISLAMSTKIILTSGLDIVDTLEIYKV